MKEKTLEEVCKHFSIPLEDAIAFLQKEGYETTNSSIVNQKMYTTLTKYYEERLAMKVANSLNKLIL